MTNGKLSLEKEGSKTSDLKWASNDVNISMARPFAFPVFRLRGAHFAPLMSRRERHWWPSGVSSPPCCRYGLRKVATSIPRDVGCLGINPSRFACSKRN